MDGEKGVEGYEKEKNFFKVSLRIESQLSNAENLKRIFHFFNVIFHIATASVGGISDSITIKLSVDSLSACSTKNISHFVF